VDARTGALLEIKLKINLEPNDFCFDDYDYEDFEKIKCVKEGIQGIHDEFFPSRDSFMQLKKQSNDDSQIINELDDINCKLQESLQNEILERILLYKRIVCEDFISYLNQPNNFELRRTIEDIRETIKYFEKVYTYCIFDEIPNIYLTCIKILSFFENILNENEEFYKIKKYCFYDFKCKYNQHFCIEKNNFDNLFNESIKYGNKIYSQFNAKNRSELKRLINDL